MSIFWIAAGIYTLRHQTIRLFTKVNLSDEEVRSRAVRRIGILYIASGAGLMLATLLYFLTPMSSQPFILFFCIFGTIEIMLRIDLNSY
ncbi:hypothetical protein [Chungangia koreensis]|uniref:hypothetical protein n=1 Tax=Chungangia koreensis TaxID=752657 RepID=UPI00366CAA42